MVCGERLIIWKISQTAVAKVGPNPGIHQDIFREKRKSMILASTPKYMKILGQRPKTTLRISDLFNTFGFMAVLFMEEEESFSYSEVDSDRKYP